MIRTLVDAVAELRDAILEDARAFDAVQLILFDLDPPFLKFLVPLGLQSELEGTPARVALDEMQSYEEREFASRRDRMRRVRDRRDPDRAARSIERQLAAGPSDDRPPGETREARARRREALAQKLSAIPPVERLKRIAVDHTINLGWVPDELIPLDPVVLEELSAETVARLVRKIGRRTRGWGRLRVRLEGR